MNIDEEDIPLPSPAKRESSFAQDFFKSGTDTSVLNLTKSIEDDDLLPDSVPVPRSRPMGRRSSARVMTQSNVTRMSSRSLLQNVKGAQPPPPPPMAGDTTPTPSSGERKQFKRASRQPSWVLELLEQGVSQEDVAAMLGEADAVGTDSGEEDEPRSSDEMLAEQYRFMALIEAKKIVQERLGYDPEERHRQRKQAPPRQDHIRPCPLPTLKPPRIAPLQDFPHSVPPREIPLYSARFIHQKMPPQAELQKGEPGTTIAEPGQMIVRCLGCKTSLQVSRQAALVQCAACSVVGPASSTRK